MGWDAAYRREKTHTGYFDVRKSPRGLKKKKNYMEAECLKCFGTFWSNLHQQGTLKGSIKSGEEERRGYFKLLLLDMPTYFTSRIDLHTDLWKTYGLSERDWILIAIPLCQYSHQFCLIRGLLRQIYSSSRVIFNTWPFSFKQLRVSDLSYAKNMQHSRNVYRFLQVHLAEF